MQRRRWPAGVGAGASFRLHSVFVLSLLLCLSGALPAQGVSQIRPGQVGADPALIAAIRASRTDEVRRLLAQGSAPVPLALFEAVRARDPAILEMLVTSGGDVNGRAVIQDRDSMELTPVFSAALAGRSDMMRVLLGAGADPAGTSYYMRREMTALELASLFGQTEIMGLLTDAGAGADPTRPATPAEQMGLATAIQEGDVEAVRALIATGIDVNGHILGSQTALSLAAGYPRLEVERLEEMVAILLQAGADVNLPNVDGSTPFMHAARRGGTALMTMLLDAGADPDARDADGRHAIFYANGFDPAANAIQDASKELASHDSAPQLGNGGIYPPGDYSAPCGKSGAPPATGMPDATEGVMLEVSTSIRGPGVQSGGVGAPECAPIPIQDPGPYRGFTMTCTTQWSLSEHTLRQTTGARTELAYLHEENECTSEEFSFTIADDVLDSGVPPACRTAKLTLTKPTALEQFAFDDADTAQVEIPLQAFAEPEDCAEEIVWTVPDIEGVQKNILSGPATGGPGEARLIYWGLPESNDDFGPITITATMAGQSAEVEVWLFYEPLATNHPESHPELSPLGADGVPSDAVPNWYYYWTQTPATLGAIQHIIRYQPVLPPINDPRDDVAARYDFEDDLVLVSDRAYEVPCRGRVDPKTLAGTGVQARGIDCFAELLRHENHHREEDIAWWRSGASSVFYVGGFIRAIRSALMDDDGDRVPTDIEAAFGWGCSDDNQRSCAQRPFRDVTDLEINAYYVGWEEWRFLGEVDAYDWSKCGKQWTAGGC